MKPLRTNILYGLLILAGLVIVGAVVWGLFKHRGIVVTVSNSGTRPMMDVAVELGCNSIELGNIAAADSATVIAIPTCTSSAAIEFRDDTGEHHRIELDTYIEIGYQGTIEAEIMDGRLIDKHMRIDIGLY